jgi:uncharacterized protein YndB with AHSA1/START domain
VSNATPNNVKNSPFDQGLDRLGSQAHPNPRAEEQANRGSLLSTVNPNAADTILTLARHFDAPPERVFDAWLDPIEISQWNGPRGVQAETTKLNARVGGAYAITMHTPDKMDPKVSGAYREIVRPSRLVFSWIWAHETQETLVTLTFKASGKGTEMTLVHTGFAHAERCDSHNNGWTGSFDKLGELLVARTT